jgi:hypothetical protein
MDFASETSPKETLKKADENEFCLQIRKYLPNNPQKRKKKFQRKKNYLI